MTMNLVLLLSLAYFEMKKPDMVFLHAGLREHLMFQFVCCLLSTDQLWQAEVRGMYKEAAFICPALAFHCSGSRAGLAFSCLLAPL